MKHDIEIRHCRVLLAIVEHGGITPAARALGVAQSTVSEAILSLERLFGESLMVRRPGRGTVLNERAKALLPLASRIVEAADKAYSHFASGGRSLQLGAIESVGSFILPDVLAQLRREVPTSSVQIATGICPDLRRRVSEGSLDAALTLQPGETVGKVRRLNDLVLTALIPARLVIVAAPGAKPSGARIELHELSGRSVLAADSGGGLDFLLAGWLAPLGDQVMLQSTGSLDGLKRGVKASDAIGIAVDYAMADDIASGELVELRPWLPFPRVMIELAERAGEARPQLLDRLLSALPPVISRASENNLRLIA